MKALGIIPARYASTRLPGKPLADICGKPMIWWVYQQALKARGLDKIVAAVDDERCMEVCRQLDIEAVMTASNHPRHIDRLHEVSEMIEADYYVSICGDEPTIQPEAIELLVFDSPPSGGQLAHPGSPSTHPGGPSAHPGGPSPGYPSAHPGIPEVYSLMRDFSDPVETNDPSNIKVVISASSRCLIMTRSPVPFPYKGCDFRYRKLVGIERFNKAALDFFVSAAMTPCEKAEEITLMRYIEHDIPVYLIQTDLYQLQVDTPHGLELVRKAIADKIKGQGA